MLTMPQSAGEFRSPCRAAAAEVRITTGWGQVRIYQRLHHGSGKVVAEDKIDEPNSFFGLHFPDALIFQQARKPYRLNWLRLIPYFAYAPAPMLPAEADIGGPPLDMSQCILRCVSLFHLEYVRKTGVNASVYVSILRTACGRPASCLPIFCHCICEPKSRRRRPSDASRSRVCRRLSRTVFPRRRISLPSWCAAKWTLLDLIPASGATVWLDGQLETLGQTPPVAIIVELAVWPKGKSPLLVVDTFQLEAVFFLVPAGAATVNGLLAASPSRKASDYVMWCRPEVVCTVTWAGNSQKQVEFGPPGDRLTPRKSFVAWQEAATRWERTSVRHLVKEKLAPFRRIKNENFCIAGDGLMLSTGAAMPFTMIVHQLVNNAAKYGALPTPADRTLTFEADSVGNIIIPAGHVVVSGQKSEAYHG